MTNMRYDDSVQRGLNTTFIDIRWNNYLSLVRCSLSGRNPCKSSSSNAIFTVRSGNWCCTYLVRPSQAFCQPQLPSTKFFSNPSLRWFYAEVQSYCVMCKIEFTTCFKESVMTLPHCVSQNFHCSRTDLWLTPWWGQGTIPLTNPPGDTFPLNDSSWGNYSSDDHCPSDMRTLSLRLWPLCLRSNPHHFPTCVWWLYSSCTSLTVRTASLNLSHWAPTNCHLKTLPLLIESTTPMTNPSLRAPSVCLTALWLWGHHRSD